MQHGHGKIQHLPRILILARGFRPRANQPVEELGREALPETLHSGGILAEVWGVVEDGFEEGEADESLGVVFGFEEGLEFGDVGLGWVGLLR